MSACADVTTVSVAAVSLCAVSTPDTAPAPPPFGCSFLVFFFFFPLFPFFAFFAFVVFQRACGSSMAPPPNNCTSNSTTKNKQKKINLASTQQHFTTFHTQTHPKHGHTTVKQAQQKAPTTSDVCEYYPGFRVFTVKNGSKIESVSAHKNPRQAVKSHLCVLRVCPSAAVSVVGRVFGAL